MVPTVASRDNASSIAVPRLGKWADVAAVCALLAITALAEWDLLVGGTVTGQDAAIYFYPMYQALGERLLSGDIPGWNSALVAGAPFAANPQSGWMYLPAMLLFTFLPLAVAAKAYLFGHLLLAGLAMYALARLLCLSVPGALLAAIAYELTGFLFERNVCCFAYTGVASWLPLALLSVEKAVRSQDYLRRALWWGVGGLALSQTLAAWLGQGSYYALLATGGFVLYRTVLAPPAPSNGLRARLSALTLHGGAILVWAFGLAAAGVLPRLEYNSLSNLAGGYPGTQAAVHSGWSVAAWGLLLERGTWYAGGATLVLALAAPFLVRGRHAVPYFVVLSLGALVLSGQGPTPLHWLMYLLPGFARLHPHDPERVMTVFYLGTALLAGATVTRLPQAGRKASLLALLPALAVALLYGIEVLLPAWKLPQATLVASVLATALLALGALRGSGRRAVPILLVLVVLADLLAAGVEVIAHGPGQFRKVDLNSYYAPTGAGRYLQGREGLWRYFGYDPELRFLDMPYRWQWADPRAAALEVNNRAMMLGLQDVQGYDPVHIARYDELMRAMNGQAQEYRGSYVLADGLDSPLLDLLGARYIVVPTLPTLTAQPRTDVYELNASYPAVYEDDRVRVLDNRQALPRVWLVHSAHQVRPGEALHLLGSGKVDPRRTALLEKEPPPLAQPAEPDAETAEIDSDMPDHIRATVTASAPALLVFSEIYYPAWKAYVDGKPAEVYVADHALRAVAVPAGEHTVELRYESMTLRLGLAISLTAYGLLGLLALTAVVPWLRAGRWRSNYRSVQPNTPRSSSV
ncbi:MAG: YfhO family protein [Chloroflexota bacterium]|nr:YfhO family protein [Chloroflexota bacterium]